MFSTRSNKIIDTVKFFIKRRNSKKEIILGRWNLEKCEKQRQIKIDYANHDHCGPCSFQELKK
jgi:hypothetical protein